MRFGENEIGKLGEKKKKGGTGAREGTGRTLGSTAAERWKPENFQ